jgi:hypothetical protein
MFWNMRTCSTHRVLFLLADVLVVVEREKSDAKVCRAEIVKREGKSYREITYIQSLDPLVKARLNALRHQAAPAPAAKVMLHALPAESIFLLPKRSASRQPHSTYIIAYRRVKRMQSMHCNICYQGVHAPRSSCCRAPPSRTGCTRFARRR